MKSMKNWYLLSAVSLLATSGLALAESEKTMMREAKVDRMHAERIALAAAHGGKIKETELERENGKLIWSCDIMKPGTKDITEVAVDAKLGKVISVKIENEAAEKKEAAEEKGKKDDKD